MNLQDKIFCALDFSDLNKTIHYVEVIKNHVGGIKLGLEFFCKNGPKGIEKLKKFELPIFLDLKLHDIPNTVTKAVKNLTYLEPDYLTVHLNGGKKMIEGIAEVKQNIKIIGVSMLTSLNKNDLVDFGLKCNIKQYVENLVKVGSFSKIDGVVVSPKEVKELSKKFKSLIFVTPGIRLPNENQNDQKRVETPGTAIKNGSNILVIGRSITNSKDPIYSIKKIIENIENELKNPN